MSSSAVARSVASLTGATSTPDSPSLPPQAIWPVGVHRDVQHKGSPGLSHAFGNFALIPVFMVIISYSEDYSPGKVSALF